MTFFNVRYPDHLNYTMVRGWVEYHCQRGSYFSGVDWENWETGKNNRMYQFIKEADAVLFALRWS